MTTLPTHRFDVIVVGAGPAGVTAAMALGKAGFSVLVCEAGVFPGAENWSGAVYFTENLEHSAAFGESVVENAPYERKLVERGAYLYNGHSLVGASLKSPDVFRSCYTVLRPVYDRYLAEVAREHGVVLACETTVQSLIRHRGRVIGVHTERGPAYADVVFLAEGDASHLVTQEGYETVSAEQQADGAPHFLQGVKEVISLDPAVIEERFGLAPGEGTAMEMLLRNATRKGRTIRLNMGGFMYTNRDSISLGFVLPLDNLKHHFEGNHNILMEWYKQLPEVARLLDGGELTSYGAKIIRGGGVREIPKLVDDGLAIGGAASGIGLDFPYPNFTGPATAMGLYFARAVQAIASDYGGPGAQTAPGQSPYTEAALRKSYLTAVRRSHYYRSVDYLRDWPAYIENTKFFFDGQLDIVNTAAVAVSRPDRGALGRWWDLTRVLRRAAPLSRFGEIVADGRVLSSTVGLLGLVGSAITPTNIVRVVWNTIGALLPLGDARVGASTPQPAFATTGVAEATSHDGARLRGIFRVAAGAEVPGRPPLLLRWYWRRFGGALASAFSEVYTNDDVAIGDKLRAAARHVGGRVSVWDAIIEILLVAALGLTWLVQATVERLQQGVLGWDLTRTREVPVNRLMESNRERIRLDDSRVSMSVPYEIKLGTITYREGHTSHIKVMWPDDLGARHDISSSALWNICPAKVYEVRRNSAGHPGIVVNFDNCIKCETCWRATDDVHWSRATQQRLIYQVYTPAQGELNDYLEERDAPTPRLGTGRLLADAIGDAVVEVKGDAAAAAAMSGLRVGIERSRGALAAFTDDLHRSPMALEAGRRANLAALAAAAADSFTTADRVWQGVALGEVRAACGDDVQALWEDAAARFAEITTHVERRRFFWAELLGRQLVDHHFAIVEAALARTMPRAPGAASDGRMARWADALAWRGREAEGATFDDFREHVRAGAANVLDTHKLRALDRGAALDDAQREWLWQLTAAVATPAADYSRRDVLLEELAAIDPAFAYLVGAHLLAADLLTAAGQTVPGGWLALVHGGKRELVDGRLTVCADFVPMAVAQHLVVVAGRDGVVVAADAAGVVIEDVGTVGLIAARIRRLRVDRLAVERTFTLGDQLDATTLEAPAAGEPWAGLVGRAAGVLAATVRGAGNYLLDRAREHASGRVQFPGAFEDEGGRDTIAKFGAVKQMLAEMEAHRYVLETAAMTPIAAADDWTHAAAVKVLASEAFGPGERSFAYLTGQLFGGTAFSEDDVIAKFYRDSAPFRFLAGHDDALRVEIGRRRLAADEFMPVSSAEADWLAHAATAGVLVEPVERFNTAQHIFAAWAREARGSDDDLLLHAAGTMVVRALAVKAVIVRAARRLEGGIPTLALTEAARLLADRLAADAPALVESDLEHSTIAAGDDLLSHGDLFPPPAIPDAEPYSAVYGADRKHLSGEWLTQGFDPGHARYVPEILSSAPEMLAYWQEIEAELRARYVDKDFNGMPYGRRLEELHLIPQEDLDYIVARGWTRMPIAPELGGDGLLKAQYYILCMLIGRYGDAALSLAVMANTSIGTTPTLIGLYQDLPRARAELERVREQPEVLGEIRDGIDGILATLQRSDLETLTAAYMQVGGLVRKRVAKSMVLRYIGAGFLRAYAAAGRAGKSRDMDGFEAGLRSARELIDDILAVVDERLEEYPRREAAHRFFLQMISAGYISAFALTEPTAGSDSGGVKTTARAEHRRVRRDEDGVLWFWLDEDAERDRRYVLDADRVDFDYDGHRLLYRYSDDAPAAVIDHSEYDYAKDAPERMRSYLHGDRRVYFTDIAQMRPGENGDFVYEFWVLNGAKMWITNGRFSHCMALYARTEPEGVTGFMVDRHAEGMVVGADEEKLGQRGSPTNEISLNNVRVPRENILGFRGRGQVNALETLNTGRAGLCVTTHSAIQEMVEDGQTYLNGEPLRHFPYEPHAGARPLERYWMGRVAEELVGTAGTTYEVIGLLDNKKTESVRMESAVGKYYGSEAQHDCVDWMERARGLEGQTWLHRVEKTRRDARVLNIYEGTNEVQRFLVLKDLVQRVLPATRKAAPPAPGGDLAHPDLAAALHTAQQKLIEHVGAAVDRFGQLVWANVGAQPCFFRLAEIAGLTKVIDAVLYRLEWCARHQTPDAYRARLEQAGRQYVRRALSRIAVLERRYEISYAYLLAGRYSPETQLGVLSLEESGAAAESWGRLPARLRAAEPQAPLPHGIEIAVLIRPVPMEAPRPRFDASGVAEPLRVMNADDSAALDVALRLRARDPNHVTLTVCAVAGHDAVDVLREALARGADRAIHIDTTAAPSLQYDTRLVAEAFVAAQDTPSPGLFLCGDTAADTGQAAVGSFVAALADRELVVDVDAARWTEDASALIASSEAWDGRELTVPLPAVVGVAASSTSDPEFRLVDVLRAAAMNIERRDAAELVGGVVALEITHAPRTIVATRDGSSAVHTPEDAVALVMTMAAESSAAGGSPAPPYEGRLLSLGEQSQADDPSCVFVTSPVGSDGSVAGSLAELHAAARLAAVLELPLDVVVPVDGDEAASATAAGGVLDTAAVRRVILVTAPGLGRFGTRGHLEWLDELWAMYRGRPHWLLGTAWANDLFARFAAGPATAAAAGRCWNWHNVETVSNGDGIQASTAIYGGGARVAARLPGGEGLRLLTLAGTVDLPDTDTPLPVGGADPEVYRWTPQLDYSLKSDALAELEASLGTGDEGLENAEFLIDFGYGGGGRDGLDQLVEPLRELLAADIGLERVMVGATRKVTQDLELLPMDRQIGQTGVSVNPKLIIALAVSGAPQHVDYIGERATILSFNIDADAPLMKLNDQRPKPIVHPIVGDVWDTVPRFLEGLRRRLKGEES
jgi:electron transfer flavoprotein-quinone oxidoreductase